jgi:hypothetical protein
LLALHNFAYSALSRCKNPAQLVELDTILLTTVVRRPKPHPFQSDLLSGLARTLLTKFNGAYQLQDLSDEFLLRLETLDRWRDSGECTAGFQNQLQGGVSASPLVLAIFNLIIPKLLIPSDVLE